jgi:hypothetical protein
MMIDTCAEWLPCNNALMIDDIGYLAENAIECMESTDSLGSDIEVIGDESDKMFIRALMVNLIR